MSALENAQQLQDCMCLIRIVILVIGKDHIVNVIHDNVPSYPDYLSLTSRKELAQMNLEDQSQEDAVTQPKNFMEMTSGTTKELRISNHSPRAIDSSRRMNTDGNERADTEKSENIEFS